MAMTLTELNEGRQMAIEVSGRLEHADYESFVPEADRLIRKHGKLSVLFTMRDFHGWSLRALWDDLNFDARHFRDFDRIAIVGEKRWQEWMAEFCKPFTTGEVRYFAGEAADKARTWIEGGE